MVSTQRIRFATFLVHMFLTGMRLQASTAWFGGGSYDGYDGMNAGAGMASLQLNNAGGATNISSTSAYLNGMLLYGGGAPASVTVYWGKSDGGTNGNWTYNHSFGVVAERVPLTHQATLDPGSTYFYRFYAHNTASDTGWSPSSSTFATPTSPVVVAGLGALPVGRDSATLNGELVAGLSAGIEFSWGSDPDPGNWEPGDVVSLGNRPEGSFRVTVSGLMPGMTYYYRIRADNGYGVGVLDPLVEFTTVSGLAWFGGGSYDGFDQQSFLDVLRSTLGSVFMFR